MPTKLYKGTLVQYMPKERYGFIAPLWGKSNYDNIFFHRTETMNGKCFIKSFSKAELRSETTTNKGVLVFTPTEPQVLYFEIGVSQLSNGEVKLKAVNLRTPENVSEEDKKLADENLTRPTIEELLHPTVEEVDVKVTPASVQFEKADKEEELTAEEVEAVDNSEEDYDDDLDDSRFSEDRDFDAEEIYDEYLDGGR